MHHEVTILNLSFHKKVHLSFMGDETLSTHASQSNNSHSQFS